MDAILSKTRRSFSIVAGDQTSPEPEASNTLCMFSDDGNTLKAVMTITADLNSMTWKYE